MSTSGGVRGGNREEPSYSIWEISKGRGDSLRMTRNAIGKYDNDTSIG